MPFSNIYIATSAPHAFKSYPRKMGWQVQEWALLFFFKAWPAAIIKQRSLNFQAFAFPV